MAGNQIKLTFLGDADSLSKATKKSDDALDKFNKTADKSGKELQKSGKQTESFGTQMGHLGSAVTGATDAVGSLADGMQSLGDLQKFGAERASRLARAEIDVESAMNDSKQAARDLASAQLDLNESRTDGRQAALDQKTAEHDYKQAVLDSQKAQKDYNDAVKEHGKNSLEAQQALLDLESAQLAMNQANIDGQSAWDAANRAVEDGKQALQDAGTAAIDAKTANQDLIDALRESKPTDMQTWGEYAQVYSGVIQAVVAVLGIATTAQWLFNAALWASPITWIVLVIAAFAAIMIYLATQTTVFQDTWKVVWDFLKGIGAWFAGPFADFFVHGYRVVMMGWDWLWGKISSIPDMIKATFSKVSDFISAPFRTAFNLVTTAWNATIGRLSWTVPSWVPGIGGNSISAPKLPKYHTGGQVSGAMGAETLAVLQAGERITEPVRSGEGSLSIGSDGSDFGDFLVDQLRRAIIRKGGNPQRVLGSSRG